MIIFSASKSMVGAKEGNIKLNKNTKEIDKKIKELSKDELSSLMKIKNKTLDNTYDFFHKKRTGDRAIDNYMGISFRQITSRKNLDNLFIISAYYGIVNANDFVTNYRLDFTYKIFSDKSLYKHQREYITNYINNIKSKYILNLASNEYYKALDLDNINKKVINLEFTNKKVDSVTLKKIRGQLVEECLSKNIKDYKKLNGFENELFVTRYEDEKLIIQVKEING